MLDVLIIGAGPAGLEAALDSSYMKLKTVVIDSASAGGALMNNYPWKRVDSCLGFIRMNGLMVANRIVKHVRRTGIRIKENETVKSIKREDGHFTVVTTKRSYDTRSVILAVGILGASMRLGIEGEKLKGVRYSVKNPKKYKGKHVLVVGGGDSAVDTALTLQREKAKVTLAHRRDELRALPDKVHMVKDEKLPVLWCTEVKRFIGRSNLRAAELVDNKSGEVTRQEFQRAIVMIGNKPNTELFEKMGIKTQGHMIKLDKDYRTSVPGVFAAGDIVCRIKRIPQAMASGERAIHAAFDYLKEHKYV